MARFQFRLQGLLNLRRMEEDRAKSAFLLGLKNYRLQEEAIEKLVRRREEAKERCREISRGEIDIELILRSHRYINILFQQIAEEREKLASLRPPLEEARAAHRKAAMRRRAMEKIRERDWKKFLREEERKEQRELDEMGQVRFQHSRKDARAGRTQA